MADQNQTTDASGHSILLTYLIVCTTLFFALIALYDWLHWDELKARNDCEAVPGHVYVWGDRRSGCVEEIGHD